MEFCIVELEVETTEETEEAETGPLADHGPRSRRHAASSATASATSARAPRAPCPCGRAGDCFLEVDGRIEDYVLTPDGRLVGRMDHAFKEQLDVAEAQILQKDQSSIDLLIVPGATYNEASHRSVLREIRSRLGQEIEVRIHLVSSIPREPNGKFRAVKSRVGRNAP